jgi:hypothetical protein
MREQLIPSQLFPLESILFSFGDRFLPSLSKTYS